MSFAGRVNGGAIITSSSTPATHITLANDATLAHGPDDSISALSFSPAANHLAVASWDSKLRIYDLTNSATGQGRALISFDGPALTCHWSEVPLLSSLLVSSTG